MGTIKKPKYISHYLVLSDLLEGIDVRAKNDAIFYHTSRIENIKLNLAKRGILFLENISKKSRYSTYKPYILLPTSGNINKAKELLTQFNTDEVIEFLNEKNNVKFSYESKGSN